MANPQVLTFPPSFDLQLLLNLKFKKKIESSNGFFFEKNHFGAANF